MPEFILSAEEMDQLDVRVTGDGGFQSLMRRFQGDLDVQTGRIEVSDKDVERIARYCTEYGQGGYQDRIARAFHSVLGLELGVNRSNIVTTRKR